MNASHNIYTMCKLCNVNLPCDEKVENSISISDTSFILSVENAHTF